MSRRPGRRSGFCGRNGSLVYMTLETVKMLNKEPVGRESEAHPAFSILPLQNFEGCPLPPAKVIKAAFHGALPAVRP